MCRKPLKKNLAKNYTSYEKNFNFFFVYYAHLVKKIDPQSFMKKKQPEVPEMQKTRFWGGGGGGAKNRLFPNWLKFCKKTDNTKLL